MPFLKIDDATVAANSSISTDDSEEVDTEEERDRYYGYPQ
jgi:hypothetical protein